MKKAEPTHSHSQRATGRGEELDFNQKGDPGFKIDSFNHQSDPSFNVARYCQDTIKRNSSERGPSQ